MWAHVSLFMNFQHLTSIDCIFLSDVCVDPSMRYVALGPVSSMWLEDTFVFAFWFIETGGHGMNDTISPLVSFLSSDYFDFTTARSPPYLGAPPHDT